jgi:hypothetical protein
MSKDKRNENRECEMKEVSELVKVNRERDSRLAVSELQQHEALNQDKLCTELQHLRLIERAQNSSIMNGPALVGELYNYASLMPPRPTSVSLRSKHRQLHTYKTYMQQLSTLGDICPGSLGFREAF